MRKTGVNMKREFTKMHGCSNDYIYFDCTKAKIADAEGLAIKLSDRHTGIGGDGIILIYPSRVADFRMKMYNMDGSEGQMCGNGVRCVAKFIYDHDLMKSDTIRIETGVRTDEESEAGHVPENSIKTIKLKFNGSEVVGATVDMGEPILTPEKIPVDIKGKEKIVAEPITIAEKDYLMTCVSMGNPHAVVFVDDPEEIDLPKIGPKFEHNPIFPARVNTEFIHVNSRSDISMRVWERGSGETLACGTGACASVMACILNDFTDDEVTVHLRGGDLLIKYERERNHIIMTGNAVTVFTGSVEV